MSGAPTFDPWCPRWSSRVHWSVTRQQACSPWPARVWPAGWRWQSCAYHGCCATRTGTGVTFWPFPTLGGPRGIVAAAWPCPHPRRGEWVMHLGLNGESSEHLSSGLNCHNGRNACCA